MYKRNQTSLSEFDSSHFMQNLLKILILLILSFPFLVIPARAELTIGIGPEHFSWREYLPNGSRALEESGYRYALQLRWQQEKPNGILFGYEGKLYIGDVHYDGMTLGVNPQPVSTDTTYAGLQNEGIFVFRKPVGDRSTLDMMASIGWEHWHRNIDPQGSNQLEEYDILFLRVGPYLQNRSFNNRFFFGAGGKLPLYTYENAHINTLCSNLSLIYPQFSNCIDKNPPMHPGQRLSLYAKIGFELSSFWTVMLYYDSYHFSPSPQETETQHGFFQPESIMDLIGFQAKYHFP